MALGLAFALFWIIGITCGTYYWLRDVRCCQYIKECRKVPLESESKRGRSATSIDSWDTSENDNSARKKARRLASKCKSRWPSETSLHEES